MKTEARIFIFGELITLALIIGTISLLQPKNGNVTNTSSSKELIPFDSITHGHDLAVDVANANKLYIATHHGLLLLKMKMNSIA